MKKFLFFFGFIGSLITLPEEYCHASGTDYSIARTNKLSKKLSDAEIINAILNEEINTMKNFKSVNANAQLGDYTLETKYSSIQIKNATPLAIAIESDTLEKKEEIIKTLLNRNQNADLFKEYSTISSSITFITKPITVLLTGESPTQYRNEIADWLVSNKRFNASVDEENNTALHKMAASNTYLENFEQLIKNGANIEAINNNGETPLHCALKLDKNYKLMASTIALNIIKNSTIDLIKIHTFTNSFGSKTSETLFESILALPQNNFNYTLLKIAINKIIDSSKAASKITESGDSLFHILASNQRLFNDFKNKVSFNLTLRNNQGETPLFTACKNADPNAREIANELIIGGSDVTVNDSQMNNLLHAAAKAGNVDVLKILLTNNNIAALINEKNSNNQTPLEIIIKQATETNNPSKDQFLKPIKLLIEYGADKGNAVNIINKKFQHSQGNIQEKLTNLIETTQPTQVLPSKPSSGTSPAKKEQTDYSIQRKTKLIKNENKIEPKSAEAVSELQEKLNNLSGKLSELKKKLETLGTQLIKLKVSLNK